QLKKELNKLLREKRESEKIKSEGISQAYSLIEEAKEIGLIQNVAKPETESEAFRLLGEISKWEYRPLEVKSENNVTKELIERRNELRIDLNKVEDNLKAARDFTKTTLGYNNEVRQQEIRLSSIHILGLNGDKDNGDICPLCSSEMNAPIPSVKDLNKSLLQLREDLQTTNIESPRLQSYIDTLKVEEDKVKTELRNVENGIASIYQENERAKTLRDLNIRRGKILGRISLFLESAQIIDDYTELDVKIENIKGQ